MIQLDIPGFRPLQLQHLVLDYNGTLALDGILLPGVAEALAALAGDLTIHVITADTFGLAARQLAGLPLQLTIAPVDHQDQTKLTYIQQLGPQTVVAIGNGRNDRKMLKAAALGIVLIQREGAAVETLAGAHIACTSILDALALLTCPKRLIATLRS